MHSCRDGDGKTFVSGQIERGPAAVHFQSLAKEKRERERCLLVGCCLTCVKKQLMGTPDDKSWPGVTELPEWANTDFPK
jgi:hypothetical protein